MQTLISKPLAAGVAALTLLVLLPGVHADELSWASFMSQNGRGCETQGTTEHSCTFECVPGALVSVEAVGADEEEVVVDAKCGGQPVAHCDGTGSCYGEGLNTQPSTQGECRGKGSEKVRCWVGPIGGIQTTSPSPGVVSGGCDGNKASLSTDGNQQGDPVAAASGLSDAQCEHGGYVEAHGGDDGH